VAGNTPSCATGEKGGARDAWAETRLLIRRWVVKCLLGRGGRWGEGGCGVARGRPGLLWSAAPRSGCVWAGDEMFDGVIPLGEGGCGRSIFLGGPRGWRVGSESSGAGRGDICVSEGLPCAGGVGCWGCLACWPALVAMQRSRSPGQAARTSARWLVVVGSRLRGLPLDARRAAALPGPGCGRSTGGVSASSPSSRSV
jgi:hypothetical protein